MLSILDVGCRYGVYDLFQDKFEKFDYIGVDSDSNEINRLKKKYAGRQIKLFSSHLGEKCEIFEFKVTRHKGYGSSKNINSQSIWFGLIRDDETTVQETRTMKSQKSSTFIDTIDNHSIVKLDIEGGELDFLNGLEPRNFQRIEAFIVEAHIDNPYLSDSNLFSIGSLLSRNGYWVASHQVDHVSPTKFYELNDRIPVCTTTIFLKNQYKPTNFCFDRNFFEIRVETLYALNLSGLLLQYLSSKGGLSLDTLRLLDDVKFVIGHKLNRLSKECYIGKDEICNTYERLFNESFPIESNFYESNFFNP